MADQDVNPFGDPKDVNPFAVSFLITFVISFVMPNLGSRKSFLFQIKSDLRDVKCERF